jgi:hypothetical protein
MRGTATFKTGYLMFLAVETRRRVDAGWTFVRNRIPWLVPTGALSQRRISTVRAGRAVRNVVASASRVAGRFGHREAREALSWTQPTNLVLGRPRDRVGPSDREP